jgi:hypothetical protein
MVGGLNCPPTLFLIETKMIVTETIEIPDGIFKNEEQFLSLIFTIAIEERSLRFLIKQCQNIVDHIILNIILNYIEKNNFPFFNDQDIYLRKFLWKQTDIIKTLINIKNIVLPSVDKINEIGLSLQINNLGKLQLDFNKKRSLFINQYGLNDIYFNVNKKGATYELDSIICAHTMYDDILKAQIEFYNNSNEDQNVISHID